ncbi:hypothetical protein GCM10022406_18840 [Hymenobacter algoricola]|uniref:Uncharacterized protein n=1 Tax=Hymenobacter algoricola TaxID=486267 RepID=A0ABP7N3L8_9BACT
MQGQVRRVRGGNGKPGLGKAADFRGQAGRRNGERKQEPGAGKKQHAGKEQPKSGDKENKTPGEEKPERQR